MAEGIGAANLCIMRSKMSVIKSKMGTIKSKIGRKFEQKRKAKWVKEKANLVKAYSLSHVGIPTSLLTIILGLKVNSTKQISFCVVLLSLSI